MALSRMKSALKAVGVVVSCLERSIQSLSRDCVEEERAIGFSSLPDELLARVFEFYCEDYLRSFDYVEEDAQASPMVLASVCRRFQRIILRIPLLWGCVSVDFTPERIFTLRTRCQNPIVFVQSEIETSKQGISDFVKQLHPIAQWRELNLQYESDESGCLLFEVIGPQVVDSFESLTTLSISYLGFLVDDDAPPPVFPTRCDEILTRWRMPKLDSLVLSNAIPSRMLRCPALKNCSISLGHFIDNAPSWNMKQLRTFIGLSLDSVESLTMVFDGTLTSEPRLTTQAYTLFKLTTLELRVKPGTDARVLEQFMGMVDAPNLSKLKVELFWSPGSSSRLPSRWLDAIFQPTKGTIRTFPNVRDFSIITEERDGVRLPCLPMLRALPRVQSLSMSIPSIELPNFSQCKFQFGCLHDLQTLRLSNCRSPYSGYIFNFLSDLEKCGQLEQFQKLELDGCCGVVGDKQCFHRLLGGKLTWKL